MAVEFTWTLPRQHAAALVAEGGHTNGEIAQKCSISKRTVERWKSEPEFLERVDVLGAELRQKVLQQGIAIRENRIAGYNRTSELLEEVRLARAADQTLQTAPGGNTGLIVRELRSVRDGDVTKLVAEYHLDNGWLRAKLDVAKQASIEMGDWEGEFQPQRKQQVVVLTLPGPKPAEIQPVPLDPKGQLR